MPTQEFGFDAYLSALTWRYGSQAMRHLWSEEHKQLIYRHIWVALAAAQRQAGLVSDAELADLQAHQAAIDVARAQEIEAEIGHDLMAALRAFAEQCPTGGGKLHLGATSADIEDNADVLRIRESLALILAALRDVLLALAGQVLAHADRPCMGYTHLQPAEPITVGYRLAAYAQDLLIDYRHLSQLRASLRGKGLKGAVGSGASFAELLQGSAWTPAQLEAAVMARLDLAAFSVTTQVYPRKQDYLVLSGLAALGQSLYRLAFDVRLLQAPPFGEWSEPFGSKQVGSSAMPFKRNPVTAEKTCALGRYLAALPRVAWDNAAHSLLERTLDDSAARRLILPDAFLVADEMLHSVQRIVTGLIIRERAVARNLTTYGQFAASERLLMALARAGADRQAMHERIRAHSMAAWAEIEAGRPNPLADLLAGDAEIVHYLSPHQVRQLLDASQHVGDAAQRARALAAELQQELA
ncbi:MAG: adenylosuccinate lyase [Chloroflexota bacterium]